VTVKIHNINGDPFRLSHLKKHLGLDEPESAKLRRERKALDRVHIVKKYDYVCLGDTHPSVAADYILSGNDDLTAVVVVGIKSDGGMVIHTTLGDPGRTAGVVSRAADTLRDRVVDEEMMRASEGEWWEDPMPNYSTGAYSDGEEVMWVDDGGEDDDNAS
jgi:hypothetical protein